jgi:hypothetical protein
MPVKHTAIIHLLIGALALTGCGRKTARQSSDKTPLSARERLKRQAEPRSDNLSQANRELRDKVRKLEQAIEEKDIELEGVTGRLLSDVDAIMAELTQLKADRTSRASDLRRVVFLLECLVNVGPEALPVIEAFLLKLEDMEYGFNGSVYRYNYNRVQPTGKSEAQKKTQQNQNVNWSTNGRYNYALNTEFALPPSLRLGLFEVLARIGSEKSEAILLAALKSTGRGIEVAMLDRLLTDVSGEIHRDNVLSVTHDLLADPPDIGQPSQLDRYHRNYLFGLLAKYRDETFVEVAKHLIVRDDGRVDTEVVNYLNRTLGARAIPLLAAACSDERLDKRFVSSLAYHVLRYVGQDPGAEAMFREIMRNDDLATLRRTAISQLAYGSNSKEVLQKKLNLINAYKEKLSEDPKVAPTLKWTEQRIQRQLDPKFKPNGAYQRNGQLSSKYILSP